MSTSQTDVDPFKKKEIDRILLVGKPDFERCDNRVISARYTVWNFVPVATLEQFRRFANLYFLTVGIIMAIGYYSPETFESALTPWTTLGPLAVVITFSLFVEGNADYKRHVNDRETNNAPCVVLRRKDELDEAKDERDTEILKGRDVKVNINKAFYETPNGPKGEKRMSTSDDKEGAPINVHVAFQKVKRFQIRQGQLILVRNREMVPADMVLLASSNDGGSGYIETSSIDGETNLKLRTSPRLPKKVVAALRKSERISDLSPVAEENADEEEGTLYETIEEAVKRLTRFSYLGRPDAQSVLEHPGYKTKNPPPGEEMQVNSAGRKILTGLEHSVRGFVTNVGELTQNQAPVQREGEVEDGRYIAALTTEPPNPSVHTFQGKLTLPPFERAGGHFDLSLDADNVLLRGAFLRNTEWIIGVAFFTGVDTKLVQNSFKTPSKFSQMDILMNFTVMTILCVMVAVISFLASRAVASHDEQFDELFYAGFNKNLTEPWPYLPDLGPPQWEQHADNWIQFFFLYVTLLTNFIPLSLYVTVELITFCMLAFVYVDLEMYDDTSNVRAVARSTIVTDLGRIQYIFSDKTGTLTQNVMRFKRCSVDGMAFGAPIQKSKPVTEGDEEEEPIPFHPLRHLLVGRLQRPSTVESTNSRSGDVEVLRSGSKLTFNAEMFLRIMCLCHTVVVEKDLDKKKGISSDESVATKKSEASDGRGMFRSRKPRRKNTADSGRSDTGSKKGGDDESLFDDDNGTNHAMMAGESVISEKPQKAADGAPYGYAYQAESPDEGALVSAASSIFGFQVITKDSNGITVRINRPSHFEDQAVTEQLKKGTISMKKLAADSAIELSEDESHDSNFNAMSDDRQEREETWTILAVNKFDSDRKRMSVLLRSPPELGNMPVLFCKGADSSMLDPSVCTSAMVIQPINGGEVRTGESEYDEWEFAQMLRLQAQLGDFASEGLRTLVLGLRVLTEVECEDWLLKYKAATVALKDRALLLTDAALEIETNLHIAGATAIEDKLQKGVPSTIATLGKAGIKLWVLTGDKRETAVEIGYSTLVLTPKMHVTEVGDFGKLYVQTQMCMEFVSLVKRGRLPEYQKSLVAEQKHFSFKKVFSDIKFALGKCWRGFRRLILLAFIAFYDLLGFKEMALRKRYKLKQSLEEEKHILQAIERRRNVRARAEDTIKQWLQTDEGKSHRRKGDDELSMVSDELPDVFQKATSARNLLNDMRDSGQMGQSALREASLAQLTAQQAGNSTEIPLVDEDTLSMNSFFPGNKEDLANNFDKRRRTLLERAFAIDRQVRKGQLRKHVYPEKLAAIDIREGAGDRPPHHGAPHLGSGPRALVIEGAALKHLLGDRELEEILFSVAETCDAVIACRVSPKQKALLVNLVRHNVIPTPITLAIGDGANDVGMIQEAHVGVGISGKEGKQAVNASDFAIAQFRFLENLVLIHGRWDFFRLSTVVLFSFYKNAVLAGMLVIFSDRTVYSGTPLYDEWLIACLNFVAGIPIIMTGLFDRCLSKDYVRRNPEVYKATRENELITSRTLFRWIFMVFVHLFTLYYFTVPVLSDGGGNTSSFVGLMRNEPDQVPGNGEGGDLISAGTVTFTCMIVLFAYKVLYETRSLIHGRWPAFTCKKNVQEGFFSRVAYTWVGVTYCSIGFYLIGIALYQLMGRFFTSSLSLFVDTANHVLGTRSLSWMLIAFVPIFGMVFDVSLKVFSNMFYPTQTQIHLEIEQQERAERFKRRQHPVVVPTPSADAFGDEVEL